MRTYWKNIFEEFFLISFFYQRKINNMELIVAEHANCLIAEQYELRTKCKLLFSVFYCKQTSKRLRPQAGFQGTPANDLEGVVLGIRLDPFALSNVLVRHSRNHFR